MTLSLPSVAATPFVMVESGARDARLDGAIAASFPHLQVIGFEPDSNECARLAASHGSPHRFFSVALGAHTGRQTLYRTPVPHYSSLYPPNAELLAQCWEQDLGFFPVRKEEVEVVDLDTYLPAQGIDAVQFWQLDTQGGELEALRGAHRFLEHSILGLRVEVFLNPLYAGQPLLGDVETFLHILDFQLFALTDIPYRLHRRGLPPGLAGHGQPVALDALYLRNHHALEQQSRRRDLRTLAVLASALGFHDYAVQIGESVLRHDGVNDTELREAHHRYVQSRLLAGDRRT